jgi:hypothetical protein
MRAMRRVLLATILACGCGHKKDREQPQPAKTPDAATAQPTPLADAGPVAAAAVPLGGLEGHIPTAAGMAPGAVPAVAVQIAADGALRVMTTGGTWEKVTAPGWSGGTYADVPSLDLLAPLLLEVMAKVDDPELAQQAKEMAQELAQAAPAPAEPPGAEDEIAFTYLAVVDDQLSAVTPLILVEPQAPGRRVVEVLDKVGGVIAVARPEGLGILRLAAPWDHLAYGGLDIEDDRPAFDITLGRGQLVIEREEDEGDRGPLNSVVLEDAAVAAMLQVVRGDAVPPVRPTLDVMVTDLAYAEHVVRAIAAFDATDAGTVGVGLSPWPYPS